jgi:hypothetical protein
MPSTARNADYPGFGTLCEARLHLDDEGRSLLSIVDAARLFAVFRWPSAQYLRRNMRFGSVLQDCRVLQRFPIARLTQITAYMPLPAMRPVN